VIYWGQRLTYRGQRLNEAQIEAVVVKAAKKKAQASIWELRARLKKTSQEIVAMEKGENRKSVLIMLEKEKTKIEEEIAAIEAKEKEQAEAEKLKAEAEKQKAEAEKWKAEAEKLKAEMAMSAPPATHEPSWGWKGGTTVRMRGGRVNMSDAEVDKEAAEGQIIRATILEKGSLPTHLRIAEAAKAKVFDPQ
jgi:hypothetical protein